MAGRRSVGEVELFSSQEWRLDNLYRIVDEQGRDVPFRMRPAQRRLFRDMAGRNIVLKARQLGFTTLIDLMALDQALFMPNTTAAIIAESLAKASEIFDRKIRHPYDSLPVEIRRHVPIASCSGSRLELANGSRISVTVSARSMTCTFLHVSEYGPVAARFPDKALEIMTGSFPAVHAGGRIFVESTAMGNSGCFYDMVQAALLRQGTGAPPLPQEFKLHFFPWYEDEKYRVGGDYPVPQRLRIYFDGLEARLGIKLDPAQRAWYAIQESQLHEEMWREYPSFPEEAFQVAQTGAYYAAQFDEIIRDRRITTVPVDDSLPVHTAWDLGVSDDMVVWFVQFHGAECRVVDYYAASGEGLPHFVRVLRERGYGYGMHFAPHDIAVRDLSSGASRLESAAGMGLRFERVMTNRDVQAGIEAVRELLGFCWFDAARTEEGVKTLRNYRREWDDRRGCYADHPLHDWASHGADAFRTLAVAWKSGMIRDAGLSSARHGVSPDDVTSRGADDKMVTFEREFSLEDGADCHLDWYVRHGIVYRIKDGAAGPVLGRLYWAWLGLDGIWLHLDIEEPGTVPATFSAAAFRLALRRVLPAGLVLCQVPGDGGMQRILSRLGFREAGRHGEDGVRWAVMMSKIAPKN